MSSILTYIVLNQTNYLSIENVGPFLFLHSILLKEATDEKIFL